MSESDPPSADATKPADAEKAADNAKPSDAAKPADAAKPSDAAKPGDAAKPNDAAPPPGGKNRPRKSKPRKKPDHGFMEFVKTWCRQHGLSNPKLHKKMAGWLGRKWHHEKKRSQRWLLLAFRG